MCLMIDKTFRFVPSLPDEFPLGRDGIQGSMIGKNIIVCSPGASKLVRVQPVIRRPVLRPIDQFTPFQARINRAVQDVPCDLRPGLG